jgi:hypothetical protein
MNSSANPAMCRLEEVRTVRCQPKILRGLLNNFGHASYDFYRSRRMFYSALAAAIREDRDQTPSESFLRIRDGSSTTVNGF